MLFQVSILMLVMVTLTQAYYPGYQPSHSRQVRTARCSGSNVACRIQFLLYQNHRLMQRTSTQQCSCNSDQGACSTNWSDPNKVISRNLRSSNMNVTLQMMFCDTVTPRTSCNNNQVSLEVSGFLLIPNSLDHYRCRCNDSLPLRLIERRVQNNRFYHKYVCGSSWNTCSTGSACMTVTNSETDYHCGCPSNMQCRAPTNWNRNTVQSIVYCSSRAPSRV
ncbi:hypothetical protein ElyMa_002052400 [Elysia marginata]|uniref:EGF-like domain-containing protein n=1 Tax=Elysia marginata TaxID=1093978 RepID=A0AAV4F8L9_9GAST|nr:hypothetical protein ElyMa_002052400 [Elysia marginata]